MANETTFQDLDRAYQRAVSALAAVDLEVDPVKIVAAVTKAQDAVEDLRSKARRYEEGI